MPETTRVIEMVSVKATKEKLIERGIAPELVEKVTEEMGCKALKDIAALTVGDLADKGVSEEDALALIAAAKGKAVKAASASAPKKVVDEPAAPFAYVSKVKQRSELEEDLFAIRDEVDKDLPDKVISDIASRLEKVYKSIESEQDQDEKKKRYDRVHGSHRDLVEKASEMYTKRLMVPHESAGVVAAHSIGEPGTQMNMRTFHNAGVANILTTQGLPRLVEIVDARHSSTPSMDIPLKAGIRDYPELARQVSYKIEATKLYDISEIVTDATALKVVITPNAMKMSKRGISVDDIIEKLRTNKALKGIPVEKLDDGKDTITVSCPPDNESFKALQALSKTVRFAIIKGIKAIERAIIVEDKENGGYKIVTEGSDLESVLEIEEVDTSKVRTNDICEIENVLGIEAARNSIIEEANATLADAGLTVDIRHIMLVADIITNIGYMKAIGRFGISGKKSSVLAKASFEITTKNLMIAAMSGVVDDIAGVAESIIVGQPVTLGTGAVEIIYKPKENTQMGDKE